MSADPSAYATLGLEPGADAASIEQAYKKLIKQYHPDREGGDAGRAAEVNRAYRELRLAGRVKAALDLQQWDEPGANGTQVLMAVAILALAGVATILTVPMLGFGKPPAVASPITLAHDRPDAKVDPVRLPIEDRAVRMGIEEAQRLSRTSDEVALADASRECHRKLRANPAIAQLDRCAAFDDAVVQLQDRDPLRNRGPFSELAVTGRQRNAATLLSDDYLAIDSRLDQVRLQVELALAARVPDPVAN